MTAAETDSIISRYSRRALTALRGDDISDGDGTSEEGCFGAVTISSTSHAGNGLHSAIIQATKPAHSPATPSA